MTAWVKTIIATALFSFLTGSVIWAEAVSEKAKYKRAESLEQLVYLDVPVQNFGTDDTKAAYQELKKQYSVALAFYFEDNYLEAYRGFLDIQAKIEKLYEQISLQYIDRTSILLQSAIDGKTGAEADGSAPADGAEKPINDPKGAVDVEFQYNRRQDVVKRFGHDREAPKEKPLYDTKEYYYAVDKQAIINNLDAGYELLGNAKRARQEAMDLEKWLENDKPIDPRMRKMRIDNYKAAIDACRQAKLNGIKAFQLLRRHDIYKVQTEFAENFYAVEKRLSPVFDLRIPAEYRIDFNDSYNKLHNDETKYKLNNENIDGKEKKQG